MNVGIKPEILQYPQEKKISRWYRKNSGRIAWSIVMQRIDVGLGSWPDTPVVIMNKKK